MANRRASVRLQTLTLCRTARRYDNGRMFDLIGVTPRIDIDPKFEYPIRFSQFDLFARFIIQHPGRENYFLRIWWLSPDRSRKELIRIYGPNPVEFNDVDGSHDHSFRLANMVFPLPGQYVILVCRKSKRSWSRDRWVVLGREYVLVEKRS